jgi:hypothetical protein
MNSCHYAPLLFRCSATPIPPFCHSAILPFCHSTIPPFHHSTNPQIRSNKQDFLHLVPHFNKEKHLCTLTVVFGVTDLCLLRKPNKSFLDSFQTLWINVPFTVLSAYIGIITTLPLSNVIQTLTIVLRAEDRILIGTNYPPFMKPVKLAHLVHYCIASSVIALYLVCSTRHTTILLIWVS